MKAPGPSARWDHVAVLDAKWHQVVVFGGAGGGSEIWLFSLDPQTWKEVIAPNGPPSLGGAGAVADAQHDRMVIFGGTFGPAMNGVWTFNFASQNWTALPTGPSARFDIGATTDGLRGWLYGGYLPGFVAVNELWQFDFASNSWSLLSQAGAVPPPRTNMAIAFYSGSLYMTGGHDTAGLTPGTWRYNLSDQTWAQLFPTGMPGAGAHFGYDVDEARGSLVLSGGDHDDGIDVATTEILTLNSPQFVRLPATTLLSPRRHTVLVLDPQTRMLFMFGGLQGASVLLGDTWLYQLSHGARASAESVHEEVTFWPNPLCIEHCLFPK